MKKIISEIIAQFKKKNSSDDGIAGRSRGIESVVENNQVETNDPEPQKVRRSLRDRIALPGRKTVSSQGESKVEPTIELSIDPIDDTKKSSVTNDDSIEIKGVWYVATYAGLKTVLEKNKRPKIVLRGDLTFYTLNAEVKPGADFVRQDPRIGTPALKQLFRSSDKEKIVYVWVRKTAMDLLQDSKVKSVTLEIDQLIRYGSTKQSKVIVMNSWQSQNSINVHAIVFSDGAFEKIEEKQLSANGFYINLNTLATELRREFPSHDVVWVDPAGEPPRDLPPSIRVEGAKAFSKLISKPLIRKDGQITFGSQFKKPALIASVGAIAYVLMISFPYQKYSESRTSYLQQNAEFKATAKITQEELADPAQLTILEMRRFFMTDPRQQVKNVDLLKQIISEVNLIKPKIWITDIRVGIDGKKSGQQAGPHQINLVIRMERDASLSAAAQAEPVIKSLSTALGVSLSSSNQGMKDSTEAGKQYRSVTITGSV